MILTVLAPPPLTTRVPVTLTLSSTTSPVPTPSATTRSPATVASFNVTSAVLITTLPLLTLPYSPGSFMYCATILFITAANSALVMFALGLICPPEPEI